MFWDYPEFVSESHLRSFIDRNKGTPSYFWSMARLLERGRVVDTLRLFTIAEIKANLERLRLTPYAKKKWKRLLEVYGTAGR